MKTSIKRQPRTKKTSRKLSKKDIQKRKISFDHKPHKMKSKGKVTRKRRIKAWMWIFVIVIISFLIALPTWRALEVYSKVVVSDEDTGLWNTLNEGIKVLKDDPLKGEEDDRINALLLGMRGEEDPNGGLLTDTIMVVSYKPSTEEIAMVSVPRDLYVRIPDYGKNIHKINSVHYLGEKEEEGGGIEFMRKTVASVLDLPIHYVVRVDMQAFKEVIDILGGIDVYLEEPFKESKQFGSYTFSLPAGENHLDSEQAFYYVQARFQTSDFDRARRQQEVLLAIKDKAKEKNILSSPTKINEIINVVEDHVRTDMKAWEMNKGVKIAESIDINNIERLVLDNSPGGFLYSTYVGEAYALRPVGNDFSEIQEAVNDIFDKKEDETEESDDNTE